MSISKALIGTPYPNKTFRYLITITFLGLSLLVAIFFSQIDVVAGITGAIGGSTLVLIVPGLLYYKAIKQTKPKGYYIRLFLSGLYVFLGLFLLIVGTYVTLTDAVSR